MLSEVMLTRGTGTDNVKKLRLFLLWISGACNSYLAPEKDKEGGEGSEFRKGEMCQDPLAQPRIIGYK